MSSGYNMASEEMGPGDACRHCSKPFMSCNGRCRAEQCQVLTGLVMHMNGDTGRPDILPSLWHWGSRQLAAGGGQAYPAIEGRHRTPPKPHAHKPGANTFLLQAGKPHPCEQLIKGEQAGAGYHPSRFPTTHVPRSARLQTQWNCVHLPLKMQARKVPTTVLPTSDTRKATVCLCL